MIKIMMYNSTRDALVSVSAAEAISRGISADGGLFVPQNLPTVSADEISAMAGMDYKQRAVAVLSRFLTDFTADEIDECVVRAYAADRFRNKDIAPLHELYDGVHMLELWHGPTCAFKDMALQILPHFMRVSAKRTAGGKKIVILVATSGDTGKAALEGFKDAENTKILVFYPEDGVSPMQKLQMTTQEGGNVEVCAIRGNFDDAQNGVKAIFTDADFGKKLADENMMFSSANSINWGRLVPQIVYYFSAYADLLAAGKISVGDRMNVVVPTGNFGNILAAYYAREMGLPINRMICASNKNNVLTDFVKTGVYDRNRDFFTTDSPSMDILISSNLERLLYALSDGNANEIAGLMKELADTGTYSVSDNVRRRLSELFSAGWCDDAQTAEVIRDAFEKYGYLCDTHTAVGLHVYEQYRSDTGDNTVTVIASTANPYKFADSVLAAVDIAAETSDVDEFEKLDMLAGVSGCEIPPPLAGLAGKKTRFDNVCNRADMRQVVRDMLNIDA